MSFPVVNIERIWLERPSYSMRLYSRAVDLRDAGEFGASNRTIEAMLANTHVVADVDGVTGADIFALYAANLIDLGSFEEWNTLFAGIDDCEIRANPHLLAAKLSRDLDAGRWSLVAEESIAFIDSDRMCISTALPEFLRLAACALHRIGRVDDALAHGEAAYAIHWLRLDKRSAAYVANLLGIISLQFDYETALSWFGKAQKYYDKAGPATKQAMIYLNLGVTCYKRGAYDSSGRMLTRSIGLGRSSASPRPQCFANIALGNVHRLTRDFESARRHLHTAYNQAQELQFPREEALALEFLGDVYRDEGQTETARRFYARAMAIGLQIAPEGDIVMELRRRNGECFGLENRAAEAMPELQRALDMSRAQKDRFEEGVILRVMAEVAYRSHDLANARRFVDKACALLVEIGARHEAAIALLHSVEVRLAEVETGRGQAPRGQLLEQAWRQATEALDLFMRVDVRWWTDKCRALVARVSAMRSATERTALIGKSNADEYAPGDVVVHASTAMRDLLQLCDMFAGCDDPALITGETGTGKEVIARRLHQLSRRADGPLVVVNVAAIPQTMFEREFFGHTKGAFSGADRDSQGFAAQAGGGTLFLDEIGDLPLEVQPKLLRLLQEGTYQAIGDPKTRRTDVRLIAATNANLRQLVAEGKFRADLFYRLQTLELDIAPLRDRPEDVLPLLRHFLSLATGRAVEPAAYFNRRSLSLLLRHDWPGNAREVAIVARRAHIALASQGRVLVQVSRSDGSQFMVDGPGDQPADEVLAPAHLTPAEAAERSRILLAIEANGGSRLLAARALGVGRSTLYRRLARLGIATRQD
ncbi:MAG: sigma 54-interacting transcriptional regulator [bacterium]|nr:sigma 54-interacting transcriptional regulator [bacterium]